MLSLPEDKDQGCVTQHCGNLEETSGLFNDTHPSPDACNFFFNILFSSVVYHRIFLKKTVGRSLRPYCIFL